MPKGRPSEQWYREQSKQLFHCDGDLEFDDEYVVSQGDDPGAYVQCWKWVTDPQCEDCSEYVGECTCEEEEEEED